MVVFCTPYACTRTSVPVRKRGKGEDKKRKHPLSQAQVHDNDRRKRIKAEEDEVILSEQDQCTLDKWKKIQQTTRPFSHPIRKLTKGTHGDGMDEGYYHHHEVLFKKQAEEMEKYQRQLIEQHRLINEQRELIELLQDQKKALIQECQTAGVTLPQIVMENLTPDTSASMSSLHSHPQSFPPHPPNTLHPHQHQQQQSKVVHHVASNPVPRPPHSLPQIQQSSSSSKQPPPSAAHHSMQQGPVLSPPMSQHPPPPVYPNVSPENCTPPPHLSHKPQQQNQQAPSQQLPPYAPSSLHPQHINHLPPPPSIRPVASSQHSVSSAMTVMSSSGSMAFSQCPAIPASVAGMQMMLPGNTFLSNHHPRPPHSHSHPHATAPIPPPRGMPMLANIGPAASMSQGASELMPPPVGGGGLPGLMSSRQQPFGASDLVRTDPSPIMRDLSFSPLTSSEFKELERQSLASYSTNPMAPFDAFPEDLENIVNIAGGLPTGSGAGYGVGVLEEDNKPPQLDLRYSQSSVPRST